MNLTCQCEFKAPKSNFRYLYNARIDSSVTLRQCPKCQAWMAVDELSGYTKQKVGPGEELWGKSSGIERFGSGLNGRYLRGTVEKSAG